MPRRIPGLIPGTLVEFVPRVFGNGFDPEPVRVWLRVPTRLERREHFKRLLKDTAWSFDKDGSPHVVNGEKKSLTYVEIEERQELLFITFVDHVENYLDESGAPILTARDLADRGEGELLAETYTRIEALLGNAAPSAHPVTAPATISVN